MRRQRRSVARHQGIAGHDDDVARRPHLQLQHARQHQGPAQRRLCRAQDRRRRSRRRFALLPRHRRCPVLLRDLRGHRRHRPRPGRSYRRRSATTTCASSTTSSWARRWFAALRPRASVRATFRASTADPTPSAARPISACPLEVQFPIFGLPRELGLKGAVFADAGTLFGYKGATIFDVNGNTIIEGFSPTTGCTFEHDDIAGMHRRPRQQGHPLLRRRQLALELRLSARSASTTPSRSRRTRASSAERRAHRRRPDPGLPLLRRYAFLIGGRRSQRRPRSSDQWQSRTSFRRPGRSRCVRWRRWPERRSPTASTESA